MRNSRPARPRDPLADQAAFPKPVREDRTGAPRTEGLELRKIHPVRDDGYKRWLRYVPCAVAGRVDAQTDQRHECWSPEAQILYGRLFYFSDPAHSGKAISGRTKRDDSGCFPLCRAVHGLQEDNHAKFDRRYGIDRHEIAARLYAQYKKEKGIE
jgi:hypothetical protein